MLQGKRSLHRHSAAPPAPKSRCPRIAVSPVAPSALAGPPPTQTDSLGRTFRVHVALRGREHRTFGHAHAGNHLLQRVRRWLPTLLLSRCVSAQGHFKASSHPSSLWMRMPYLHVPLSSQRARPTAYASVTLLYGITAAASVHRQPVLCTAVPCSCSHCPPPTSWLPFVGSASRRLAAASMMMLGPDAPRNLPLVCSRSPCRYATDSRRRVARRRLAGVRALGAATPSSRRRLRSSTLPSTGVR
ncbi:hypothetical protein BDV95DRAFT_299321 [Massariosphaeria phaeospora]|uniref:Uncharacterized protein n=1 Tax=Massariosphaeria phaeospora TaxID=100035 RepID=A0A7C8II63_9PLEO|nr:hypothetical protein BDV95DRAFT_299321 [Massariosphaeria phaeospora]